MLIIDNITQYKNYIIVFIVVLGLFALYFVLCGNLSGKPITNGSITKQLDKIGEQQREVSDTARGIESGLIDSQATVDRIEVGNNNAQESVTKVLGRYEEARSIIDENRGLYKDSERIFSDIQQTAKE